jgi:CRP-like cAMP-binding protein
MKCLQSMPMFRDVSMAKLKLVALAGQRLDYQPSEEIIAQGSAPDAVYIVLDGQVEVMRLREDAVVPITKQGEGYIAGDLAVLLGEPAPVTVVAVTAATVLKLDARVFLELVREVPQLSMAMMQDLARRLLRLGELYTQAVA